MLYTITRITSENPKRKNDENQLNMAIASANRSLPQHLSIIVGEGRCIFATHNYSLLQHVVKEPQLWQGELHN
jgi:hypothetical protein